MMIQLQPIPAPRHFTDVPPVLLTDATLLERKNKVLTRMNEAGFDALVIYADKEHGG
ncbi:MAG TPA: Xaa-Pro aminopeptidase, partial [Leclercia adecarboxylata]|nr:Xaa-Pro aminopeptidase [Leclercia adecarboxylata]HBW40368.1 Xaa-Pro aminopeptidase [Leclercia adecarboxylata]